MNDSARSEASDTTRARVFSIGPENHFGREVIVVAPLEVGTAGEIDDSRENTPRKANPGAAYYQSRKTGNVAQVDGKRTN